MVTGTWLPVGGALDDQLGLAREQLPERRLRLRDDVEQRVDREVRVEVLLRRDRPHRAGDLEHVAVRVVGVDRLDRLVLDLHLDRPLARVEAAPVLQQVLLVVDVDREVPGAHEELRDVGAEAGVDVALRAGRAADPRLGAEVVEERDPVVVADVEEEVDEVRVVLRAPAGGADRVHDGEAEHVAVEAHRRRRVERRERDVVDPLHAVVQLVHDLDGTRGSTSRVNSSTDGQQFDASAGQTVEDALEVVEVLAQHLQRRGRALAVERPGPQAAAGRRRPCRRAAR